MVKRLWFFTLQFSYFCAGQGKYLNYGASYDYWLFLFRAKLVQVECLSEITGMEAMEGCEESRLRLLDEVVIIIKIFKMSENKPVDNKIIQFYSNILLNWKSNAATWQVPIFWHYTKFWLFYSGPVFSHIRGVAIVSLFNPNQNISTISGGIASKFSWKHSSSTEDNFTVFFEFYDGATVVAAFCSSRDKLSFFLSFSDFLHFCWFGWCAPGIISVGNSVTFNMLWCITMPTSCLLVGAADKLCNVHVIPRIRPQIQSCWRVDIYDVGQEWNGEKIGGSLIDYYFHPVKLTVIHVDKYEDRRISMSSL